VLLRPPVGLARSVALAIARKTLLPNLPVLLRTDTSKGAQEKRLDSL